MKYEQRGIFLHTVGGGVRVGGNERPQQKKYWFLKFTSLQYIPHSLGTGRHSRRLIQYHTTSGVLHTIDVESHRG